MKGFMIKHSGLRFLSLFAAFCLTCVVAVAENGEGLQRPPGSRSSPKKEVLTTLEQRMLKKISIDFRNTPVEDVIRIMAEKANVDIIKSSAVIGNVTATLTDVPLEKLWLCGCPNGFGMKGKILNLTFLKYSPRIVSLFQ